MAARAFNPTTHTTSSVVSLRRAGRSSIGREDALTGVFVPSKPSGIPRALHDHTLYPRPSLKFSMTADDFWGQEHRNVLHTLYVAQEGGPDVYLMPAVGGLGSFGRIHEECLVKNQALLTRINELNFLVLAPAKLIRGEHEEPIFWGWLSTPGVPCLASHLLGNNQMALILDLDHTLVESHTMDTLEERKKQCGHERQKLHMREDVPVASLLMEEDMLQGDIKLLCEFSTGTKDVVHVEGIKYIARPETAYTDDGSKVQRPVIRLPDGCILTRIDPLDPKTSTLVRMRPGWSVLREYLLERSRYDIYVCSHATREYTLEAWRLLDFDNAIIPHEQRRRRIFNVPRDQPKALLGVLGARMGSDEVLHGEDSAASAQFPLAVVVDDKKEAWEESSQPHVLQVTPFMYHRNEAACNIQGNTTVAKSDHEMDRVSRAIKGLRSTVYECVKERVRPEMDRIAEKGLQMIGTAVANPLPRLRSVPELLQASAEGLAAVSSPQEPRCRPDLQVAPSTAATAATAPSTAATAATAPSTAATAATAEATQQTGPSTVAQGSSPEQGLAKLQGLDSNALANVDKNVLDFLMELVQADPLFLQVVSIIMQLMLSKPDCRHMGQYVIEACERHPSCLPRAAEFLKCQPELGLMSLYCELQVEEHRAAKMAALIAAGDAAARLASSQAEVEKLREHSTAQAKALAAAEAAAGGVATQLARSQVEVEELQAQLATRQNQDAQVAKNVMEYAKDMMEYARKLQGGEGSSSERAQSRKRHREDDEAWGAKQKEAVSASATEDEGIKAQEQPEVQQEDSQTHWNQASP